MEVPVWSRDQRGFYIAIKDPTFSKRKSGQVQWQDSYLELTPEVLHPYVVYRLTLLQEVTDIINDEKWVMLVFGKGSTTSRKRILVQRAWNDKNVLIGKGGRKPRFYFIVRRKDIGQ